MHIHCAAVVVFFILFFCASDGFYVYKFTYKTYRCLFMQRLIVIKWVIRVLSFFHTFSESFHIYFSYQTLEFNLRHAYFYRYQFLLNPNHALCMRVTCVLHCRWKTKLCALAGSLSKNSNRWSCFTPTPAERRCSASSNIGEVMQPAQFLNSWAASTLSPTSGGLWSCGDEACFMRVRPNMCFCVQQNSAPYFL